MQLPSGLGSASKEQMAEHIESPGRTQEMSLLVCAARYHIGTLFSKTMRRGMWPISHGNRVTKWKSGVKPPHSKMQMLSGKGLSH